MNNYSRRSLLMRGLAIISIAPLLHRMLSIQDLAAQTPPLPLVDEKSPKSLMFGLVHDATKADIVKFPKRAGPEGAKQFCNNCQLLTQRGLTATGHTGECGKCALFPEGLVGVNGWCNSWVPKAA